ncbi:MAG: prolyl oligopeptidase family serine peptidase [Spirochaetes bacterium]|nr:prolyl oligopeptidase family serine peptidase [Spirochaetota bacterium]
MTFDSAGSCLQGIFFHWTGIGPRPTLLLLHGIPGTEQNIDIARAIHRKRWNSLVFHYRGCWGSQGNYSIPGILEDAEAAARFLRGQEIVDTSKIAIAGLSLGGWAAIASASRDPGFRCVVPMAPASGLENDTNGLRIEDLREFNSYLSGTTPEKLQYELRQLLPIASFAAQLRNRRILLVTADRDESFPPERYTDFSQAVP